MSETVRMQGRDSAAAADSKTKRLHCIHAIRAAGQDQRHDRRTPVKMLVKPRTAALRRGLLVDADPP